MDTTENDQIGGSYTSLTVAEKESWEVLVTELRLEEKFIRKPSTHHYSWDNMHVRRGVVARQDSSPAESSPRDATEEEETQEEQRVLKRLDRIYLSEEILEKQEVYEILSHSSESDHAPVRMRLSEERGAKVEIARYRMNTSLLRDEGFRAEIMDQWRATETKSREKGDQPARTLKKCLRKLNKTVKMKGKQLAREKRAQSEEAKGRIRQLYIKLQEDPQNHEVQTQIQEVKDELDKRDVEKAKWIQQRIDAKWMLHGDVPSRVFFGLFKTRQKQLEMSSLLDEEGNEITEENRMCEIAERHFQSLLAQDKGDEERLADIMHIMGRLNKKAEEKDRELLERQFDKEELYEAAKAMKGGKSPGPDGTPVEFYVDCWNEVGDSVTKVIQQGADEGWFPNWFNLGDVVLLPKTGDQRLLGNKRPITLLNTMYKIYTKAIQRRFVPVLQKLVSWNQSAFLPERNIHTSVLACNEALHAAKNSGRDFLLMQLDFKKAFDSVNWRFLIKVLRALNFGVRFQGYIKAILTTTSSCIVINGNRSKPVQVTRSVRQGCPLSPLLFILVTEMLTVAVKKEVEVGSWEGIYVQRANMHYCLGFFADDSHMIVRATKEGAQNVQELLERFANASGLQIQWRKSAVRWIGPKAEDKPEWTTDMMWSWKGKGEDTTLLGFSFEEGIKAEEIERRWTRNRAARKIITQETRAGGLGLISLTKQYAAFATRTIQWAFHPREHPLQKLIRQHIVEETVEASGALGMQWITVPTRSKFAGMSKIWGSAQEAQDGRMRKVNSQARRLLWEDGYKKLEDMLKEGSDTMADWEDRRYKGREQRQVRKAYEQLRNQIRGPNVARMKGAEKIHVFFETDTEMGKVWEWQ
ncbi:hypothetical protein R1sor_020725 [Riccia sorocarpa]|uniref:Reverse transcriptase domain-containing protein n=1 Tax=Riccia sorocarpa TaxID=122646 RepID=A0ABD3GJ87_9MARC